MKFFMPVLLAAIFLVGCERLEGQLNISKDLKLVNSKGDTHLLKVGSYSADLRESTFGKKIILRLNNDSDEKFHFAIPSGTKIPDNGTFRLSSAQIGQKVDLSGSVRTTSSDSPIREDYESCTYNEPYTVCSPSGPYGQVICQTYMRTVYGQQWTRYFDRTTTQDVLLSIASAGSTEESAQFSGATSWGQRVIVNQMPCR
ncbi:MAG: hypothetical protein ACXVLQ_04675 [Bacteriovorax sp.]